MIEIIKYLSPVALLALVWGVFQFYQKRSFEIKDKRKVEFLEWYNLLNQEMNKIQTAILDILHELHRTVIIREKEIKILEEEIQIYKDEVNRRSITEEKVNNLELELKEFLGLNKDFNLLEIPKEDFEKIVKEHLKKHSNNIDNEDIIQICKSIIDTDKTISKLKAAPKKVRSKLNNHNSKGVSDKLNYCTKSIKDSIKKLDSLPIISSKNFIINLEVKKLIIDVNRIILLIETNSILNENGLYEGLFSDDMLEVIKKAKEINLEAMEYLMKNKYIS